MNENAISSTPQNNLIPIEIKQCRGYKWFIRVTYKVIETDIEIYKDKLALFQGSGFSKVKAKEQQEIMFRDIDSIKVSRRVCLPNLIFAGIALILTLISGVWAGLLAVAAVLIVGSAATVTIFSKNLPPYRIPTEFKSEANELKDALDQHLYRYSPQGQA